MVHQLNYKPSMIFAGRLLQILALVCLIATAHLTFTFKGHVPDPNGYWKMVVAMWATPFLFYFASWQIAYQSAEETEPSWVSNGVITSMIWFAGWLVATMVGIFV